MYASRSFLKSDLHLHTTLPKYSTYSNIQVSSLIRFNVALNALPKLCNVLQNFKLVLDIPLHHNKLLNFNLLQHLTTRSYFHMCSYMVNFGFSYFLLDNQQICLINEAWSYSIISFSIRFQYFPTFRSLSRSDQSFSSTIFFNLQGHLFHTESTYVLDLFVFLVNEDSQQVCEY